MSGDEFIVAIVAIVFGTALLGFVIGRITGLIKQWLKSRNQSGYNDSDFERMAKAFMKHKKEMEQRVRNLEAAVGEEKPEIEYPELEEPDDSGNLNNDLETRKQKKRS